VVQLYLGEEEEDSYKVDRKDLRSWRRGDGREGVEEFMVWSVPDCVDDCGSDGGEVLEVYTRPVPKCPNTKWLLGGAAFLSSCSTGKLHTASLATSLKFMGGALSVATPIALVQQASIVPSIPHLSLSAIYWNLPTVGAAVSWISAAVTVPNVVMAATAYIMVK
ncbi:hypothetical protein FOL47_002802, partial [Perkinsus chesapeaki]